MKINSICQTNNSPSFHAIKFENKYMQQQFVSALKRQPVNEFSECLNIIKAQDSNAIPITIGWRNLEEDFSKTLNLKATINYNVIEAGKSLLEFLKKCANIADNYNLKRYEYYLSHEGVSETTVKDLMYNNVVKDLKLTDLPKEL